MTQSLHASVIDPNIDRDMPMMNPIWESCFLLANGYSKQKQEIQMGDSLSDVEQLLLLKIIQWEK
jgi:hypothetical protein